MPYKVTHAYTNTYNRLGTTVFKWSNVSTNKDQTILNGRDGHRK